MTPIEKLFEFIDSQKHRTNQFLSELIKFPSTLGSELPIQQYIFEQFNKIAADTKLVPIDNSIKQDTQYSACDKEIDYKDKFNVVAKLPGSADGRSLILNCHSDVVPADDWPDAFEPKTDGDTIIGRGACDDKGQIAVVHLVLSALKVMDVQLAGDLIRLVICPQSFSAPAA